MPTLDSIFGILDRNSPNLHLNVVRRDTVHSQHFIVFTVCIPRQMGFLKGENENWRNPTCLMISCSKSVAKSNSKIPSVRKITAMMAEVTRMAHLHVQQQPFWVDIFSRFFLTNLTKERNCSIPVKCIIISLITLSFSKKHQIADKKV